ncbi:MAG TPA: hypothetical protein VJV23_04295 [Candidatus Polarisedimenticolia bacterium]|nr:hypothetical protein [Candidatus Polarisedimenticolia bacterium]
MNLLAPGIHEWSVFNDEKGLDFNGHLVLHDQGNVLIDPPALAPGQVQAIEQLGRPAAILITNAHHTRDASAAAALWRIPVLISQLDFEAAPAAARPGGTFRDGERLPGGLVALALSGQKTAGETALLCPRSNAIILGDALLGKPAGRLSMLPDAKYADPAAARRGLERLLQHPFDAVLVGDGASIPRGGRRAVVEFLSGV